jgi:hypothetical protein
MISEKDLIILIKKAAKKRTLKKFGLLVLISEKRLQLWIDGKEKIPTHARYIIKKICNEVLGNTKKT